MTPKQVGYLTDRIQEQYPKAQLGHVHPTDTNPHGLAARVLHFWVPELVSVPADIAMEALRRYGRTERYGNPPTPEDMTRQCEAVQDERDRLEAQAKLAAENHKAMEAWARHVKTHGWPRREPMPSDIVGQVLEEAAHDPWARAHLTMHEKFLNRPGQEAGAIAYCEIMAREQPENREAWLREAVMYQRWQHEAPRTPGEPPPQRRPVPMMTGTPIYELQEAYTREPGDDDE